VSSASGVAAAKKTVVVHISLLCRESAILESTAVVSFQGATPAQSVLLRGERCRRLFLSCSQRSQWLVRW
jgi:hypothetical protein